MKKKHKQTQARKHRRYFTDIALIVLNETGVPMSRQAIYDKADILFGVGTDFYSWLVSLHTRTKAVIKDGIYYQIAEPDVSLFRVNKAYNRLGDRINEV